MPVWQVAAGVIVGGLALGLLLGGIVLLYVSVSRDPLRPFLWLATSLGVLLLGLVFIGVFRGL
jgi:hypothetical protein